MEKTVAALYFRDETQVKMNCIAALFLIASLIAITKGDPTSTAATTPAENADSTTPSEVSKSPEEIKQKIKEQVEALTESCKTQTKVTPEQAKIATTQTVPKTEPEKCFMQCIYTGLQLVTKDGKSFNEQMARALAQKRFGNSPDELAKANTMINACVKEVIIKDPAEKCALGRLIRECFVKNGAKINFFPKA